MVLWDVPSHLEIGVIPKKIYCNKDLVKPLEQALTNLTKSIWIDKLITWDGCFNIRNAKESTKWSLHAWGLAIDINAAWNRFNRPPEMKKPMAQCFIRAGFDWGGSWKKPDGMHFQLAQFPV